MHEPELIPGQKSPIPAFHLSNRQRTIIAVLITAIVFGIAGYWLGSRNTQSISSSQPSPSRQQAQMTEPSAMLYPTSLPSPLPQPTSVPEPSPMITPIPCPSAPQEGDPSKAYIWKTYTCQSLGVSFLYPTNLRHSITGFTIDGGDNIVKINENMGYIFRIAKFTTNLSLEDWLKPSKDDLNLGKQTVIHTTFHGYPAYSVAQKPESIEGQVPMNLYVVRVNPTTIYKIEYEIIPDPRNPDLDPPHPSHADIQKILESVVFITEQE